MESENTDSLEHDRSVIHQRVRRQHSSEIAHDYVEAIHEIRQTGSLVRVSDLQEVFGVSHVTVIRTLKRLYEKELITGTKSKEISLTDLGESIARRAQEKHEIVRNLFVKLGVSREQSDADAEGVEHHLSEETLNAIQRFLESTP